MIVPSRRGQVAVFPREEWKVEEGTIPVQFDSCAMASIIRKEPSRYSQLTGRNNSPVHFDASYQLQTICNDGFARIKNVHHRVLREISISRGREHFDRRLVKLTVVLEA